MSKLTPRPELENIDYYMLGISKLPGFDKIAKLSSNESPLGMSPRAIKVAREAVETSHRYPEIDADVLKNAIANTFDLNAKRITTGPGSDELLLRIVNCFARPGEEVVFSEHAYMQFPIYARTAGAIPKPAQDDDFRHDVTSIADTVTDRTRVVIIANPDNPSGTHLSGAEVRELRAKLPDDVLLLIDAAYEEYAEAEDYETGTALVHEMDNVIVTRTFSKIFGMAGLRLGWCYAAPETIDLLERIGPSFPANVIANAAAVAALEDTEHTEKVRAHNREWVARFRNHLEKLGIKAYPSQTNFVLTAFPTDDGKTARDADLFLQERGIVARRFNVADFEDKLRFSIGTDEEMERCCDALQAFMER